MRVSDVLDYMVGCALVRIIGEDVTYYEGNCHSLKTYCKWVLDYPVELMGVCQNTLEIMVGDGKD